MLHALIPAWLNIKKKVEFVMAFTWGDPFQDSYSIYLINVYIFKWMHNFVPRMVWSL